jgi:hypothetical protein
MTVGNRQVSSPRNEWPENLWPASGNVRQTSPCEPR